MALLIIIAIVQFILAKVCGLEQVNMLIFFVPELIFDVSILVAYVVIYLKLKRGYFDVHGR